MPRQITYYECTLCGTLFTTKYGALSCEQSHPKTSSFLIGDYVYTSDWFGTVREISETGDTIKVSHPSGRSRWIPSSSANLFI